MPTALCCSNPFHASTDRPLSPIEPPRPALTNLNAVFALAALPSDHPDAFRQPTEHSHAHEGLICSPGFVRKVKGQVRRRRTMRDLKLGRDLDGDARRICTGEVEEMGGRFWGEGSVGAGEAPRLSLRDMSPLNSSPELMRFRPYEPGLGGRVRRCRSSVDLGSRSEHLALPDFATVELTADPKAMPEDLAEHQLDGAIAALDVPEVVHVKIAELSTDTGIESTVDTVAAPDTTPAPEDPIGRSESSTSVHLSKLHIAQQLRSMSQLSDLSDRKECLTPETWTFHRRERSKVGLTLSSADTGRGKQARGTSISGVDSAKMPASWGRVRDQRDNSSSIYSRPTSPEEQAGRESKAEIATWPLAEVFALPALARVKEIQLQPLVAQRQDGLTPTLLTAPPTPQTAASAKTLSTLASQHAASLTPAGRTSSGKSASSNLTKRSKFLERLTPPKKLVKKNRSFFRFLRAGSSRRQQQTRSVSTPVLGSTPLKPSGRFDGPADERDGDTLTVQYDLIAPVENTATRSASAGNLPSFELTQESLDTPGEIVRKPSLADYERNLSLIGDDRRRPSAVNLRRLSEIREDDRRASVQVRRSFSHKSGPRENNLMAAALERQLAEKEMFRMPSRRRASGQISPPPTFTTTAWAEPGGEQPQSPERDPLEAAVAGPSSARRPSSLHLSPPQTPLAGPSGSLMVPNGVPSSSSKKPVLLETPSSTSQPSSTISRKVTPLASWSRYPSHTREERCASAGLPDHINTHDFAVADINPAEIRTTDESEAFDPARGSLTRHASKRSKTGGLPRSRSATFGAIVRYYSNVFSNAEFHMKGRRSSVAAGGHLKDPELEILPPIMPAFVNSQTPVGPERRGTLANIHETPQSTSEDHSEVDGHAVLLQTPGFNTARYNEARRISSVEPSLGSGESEPLPNERQSALPLLGDHPSSPPQARRHLHLDGATDTQPALPSSPSKAELFSSLYQTCLTRPLSPPPRPSDDSTLMPPPSLKPTKARSPRSKSHDSLVDPASRVRRFPSVTVVDDRKGHWRSVSFISVKSDRSSQSFLRDSSNDLLKMMEEREREEREKLMMGT